MDAATKKAWTVSLFFTAAGVFGWMSAGLENAETLPLLLYYGALIVNTFFSIQVLSAITPKSTTQTVFDITLVGIYCGLAFSFSSTATFSLVSAGLFMFSIAKYLHLSRITTSSLKLLRRKIWINALGALLSLIAAGLAALGSPLLAAWLLGVVFTLASIYLLTMGDMYRSDQAR